MSKSASASRSATPSAGAAQTQRTLNINVGILGHVDSGKTSIAKALSTIASTAAFDKHPESKRRGITLDLGFSAFSMEPPPLVKDAGYDKLQVTLVDCPGHASLVRTVIGGAQIIDFVLLVVDAVKGIQTQTAECLVLANLLHLPLLCALNKVDLFPAKGRDEAIQKATQRIRKGLGQAGYGGVQLIGVAANPSPPQDPEEASASDPFPSTNATPSTAAPIGMDSLLTTLSDLVKVPSRSPQGDFVFEVDHCFGIKGVGTVMTGTVLNGSVRVGDTVEIPSVGISRKVKSMQMFHKPVDRAMQGDRLGLCVTQFDPDTLERGLVCSPGAIPTLHACIIKASKVKFFKQAVESKAKFHISVGHDTVIGEILVFSVPPSTSPANGPRDSPQKGTSFAVGEQRLENGKSSGESTSAVESRLSDESSSNTVPSKSSDSQDQFDASLEYEYRDVLLCDDDPQAGHQYALIEFEKPVTAPRQALVIGSKLDMDIHSSSCRLAFSGTIHEAISGADFHKSYLQSLRIFKRKRREGTIDRIVDERHLIGRGLLKKETPIEPYLGLKVSLTTGAVGYIESSFGQTGKYKCTFPNDIDKSVLDAFTGGSGGKKGKKSKMDSGKEASSDELTLRKEDVKIVFEFKRYIYDTKKKMVQS
ncbi:P-loop containing nucleoside triphosphate hydrolase protein [Gonapodya prolifera JEL478]|uniref:p-loop containing nucleoside triphosphate hydrolase protein n=1 Tax=Gonapodya prolifera (strain JEL478) TaxID=1344416 RepID=A0A139AV91_GONPJ|nr:P-loop containing nucleoside triphosphate hydrolase protein [Gonapodya prolifera JEL478]|eukprot:KXS20666.1 P-loop containing nucleoside triphosphate hydrolase protein [Gonapodya prolifera JEL478]